MHIYYLPIVSISVLFFANISLAEDNIFRFNGSCNYNDIRELNTYISEITTIYINKSCPNIENKKILEDIRSRFIGEYTYPDMFILHNLVKYSSNKNISEDIYNIYYASGSNLSLMASRYSIWQIIYWASREDMDISDYLNIKEWITYSLNKNSLETIIALRQIYKQDMYFYDKNVEKILKDIYQEAMDKY